MVIRKHKTACMLFLLDSAGPEHMPIRASVLVESPPAPQGEGVDINEGRQEQ